MARLKKTGGTGRGLPPLGVRLPDEQRLWIQRRAKERGSSQSEVVRELVDAAMNEDAASGRTPSIVDAFAEIAASVPLDAWESLPVDLTDQLDHYLYGTSRR